MGEPMPAENDGAARADEASGLMKQALAHLDRIAAPADIGALLNEAISRLDDWATSQWRS